MPITAQDFTDWCGEKISPLKENENFISVGRGQNNTFCTVKYLYQFKNGKGHYSTVPVEGFETQEKAIESALSLWETI